MDRFTAASKVPDQGWERRFARPFALSYAAAMLAQRWGILPWQRKEIVFAIRRCYRDARKQVPDMDALLDEAVGILKEVLRGDAIVRLSPRADECPSSDEIEFADGFRRDSEERGAHYLIKPKSFERLFDPIIRRPLLEWLDAGGHLITEPGRSVHTIQAKVRGIDERQRYYGIKVSALRDESGE